MRDGWKKVTLGDVAFITDGDHLPPPKTDYGIPFIYISNIEGFNKINFADCSYVPEDYYEKIIDKRKVKENDILYTVVGSYGIPVLVKSEIKFCFQRHIALIRAKKINSDFLVQALDSGAFRLQADKVAIGEAQKTVTLDNLRKMTINLPPLSDQLKIAETLSVWDSAIEKTEKLISEKEKKLQWIIIHYFENAEKNKNWIESKLSEFLKPGDKHPVENTANYRKITIKLHKNGIEYINSQRKMADTRPFYIRRAGELIIGKQNYFNGSIALLEKDFDGAICSNAIMSFSIAKSINPDFLLEAISTKKYLREKSVYANGTGQKELSENVFLSFDVKLPSLKVQNEIMEIVNLQKSEISLLKRQLEQYKLQKQGLMQKLLTGKWRVR